MRKRTFAASALALLALSACSGSGFENEDPEAHSACTKFLEEPTLEGVPEDESLAAVVGTALIVGEHAAKATTPEINATAEKLDGLNQWLIDDAALIEACESAGYEVDDMSVAARYLEQNPQ